MTRTEIIAKITSTVAQLPDEQLEALAEYTAYLAGPTVYSTLPKSEKDAIDAALDSLDAGKGVPWDVVSVALDQKLKAAGA